MCKKRLLAGMTALVFCLFVLFSSTFIIVEANHGCSGEGCQVCAVIQLCAQFLESAVAVSALLTIVCTLLCVSAFCLTGASAVRPVRSLVTLKVKLSN